jgi:hypothetical protein
VVAWDTDIDTDKIVVSAMVQLGCMCSMCYGSARMHVQYVLCVRLSPVTPHSSVHDEALHRPPMLHAHTPHVRVYKLYAPICMSATSRATANE